MANKHKVGMVFAVLLGGFHLMWALLVLLGWAQPIYNFILWAHMVHIPLVIGPFEMSAALSLLVLTTVLGYIFGYVGAWAWNRFNRPSMQQ